MPENIGGASAPFNTQIPSIVDNADIQTAFRLYHYGSNTSTPSVLPADSLAGHLNSLNNTKVGTVPTTIPNAANLNTYTTTGFYTQTNNTFASGGTNYPAPYAGLLTVVNEGSVVFQQYQVVGAAETASTENYENIVWWRFFYAGSWKKWRKFVDDNSFTDKGDGRYYTQTFINNNFATLAYTNSTFQTIADANNRQLLLENVKTGNHVLESADANKVVAMNNSAPATVTVPNSSTFNFPIGTVINIYAMTGESVTVTPALGVELRNAGIIYKQYVEISLRKRGLNEWVIAGSMRAA